MVSLPDRRATVPGRLRPVERAAAPDPGPPVECPLSGLEPVTLEPVSGKAAMAERTVTLRLPDGSAARDHAPVRLRLLRYTAGGTEFVIGTTLSGRTRFPTADIERLHARRWSVEELYRTSETSMKAESLAARTENGVRQEFHPHMNMIAAVRLSANGLEAGLNHGGGGKLQVSLTNALRVVYRSLEEFMTGQADAIAEAVSRGLEAFARCVQKERPERSYPRKSRNPINKWARN